MTDTQEGFKMYLFVCLACLVPAFVVYCFGYWWESYLFLIPIVVYGYWKIRKGKRREKVYEQRRRRLGEGRR